MASPAQRHTDSAPAAAAAWHHLMSQHQHAGPVCVLAMPSSTVSRTASQIGIHEVEACMQGVPVCSEALAAALANLLKVAAVQN